jgi:hypothetical protein
MGDGSGRSVLLLADAGDGAATSATCGDLLDEDPSGAPTAELRVSFSAADVGPRVSAGDDRRPERKGLVSVGDEARSASAEGGPDFSGSVAIDAVDDPGNLREIGLSVSRFCERWDDARITVCFDSLGDLLAHANDDATFRFTTLLNKRLDAAGATAHFHLDPDAHEDSVVNTFGSIFDDVVRPERGGAASDDGDDGAAVVEASDEEIARLAEEFEDEGFAVVEGDAGAPTVNTEDAGDGGEVVEASDEEIAQIFD